ncbi:MULTISPECIES: FAD-dependent monooxygenase [Nostocales]|uniref:TubC N-terminal docking domain-related protein n=1 Tax=Nostocales TaxID=1161 RepID=UPI00029B6C83|nr:MULTISPECIES: FAD-dependent monooxygenase [Nostocales]AFW94563.1 putative halogenase ApdC [Anabaena sp. 90]MTJ18653.1 NAD(P)/FAD-dependent oxidoreductase [Dolichospermum sp. UHCC 0299]MTJ20111.1 NAD(P)/FAD-dependent oxidoreductase [Dolichospermum sp. UHCC 0352]MTJ40783.1 NAD(P)/FAD-dependent oxidoreductase [Dolichospermum sp. UHCC 0406]
MKTVNFLSHLNDLGINVWVENDKLRYRSPKGVIIPELLQELKERKEELIAFLRQQAEDLNQAETYDVVICGGGLAGLTLARQLKLQKPNMAIAVLDKMSGLSPEASFKVGESTVEVGAFYLANTLQLTDYFEEQHLVKLGLRYFFNNSATNFQERPELGLSEFHAPNSYQIDRGKLENDLRQFNMEAGVELREGCLVNEIALAEGLQQHHKVVYTQGDGDNRKNKIIKARWVVDAMGRRRFLQRKLGLDKPNNDNFGAVWFRVNGRFDIGDFVPSSEEKWHNRVPNKNRYYSTNHLCGEGYWVWTIPLSTGHTSIGIVARQDIHPLKNYYNYELAYQWLQKNEPVLACHLKDKEPEDFRKMPKYSYSSKQVFSSNRWACVGEAGTFPDPFYSPGTDNIGFGNSLTTQLIALDLEDKLTKEKVEDANYFYISYSDGVTLNIQNAYNCLGNGIVMATKFIWDTLSGWTFSGLMMFNSIFLDQDFRTRVQEINSKFFPLSYRMQQLFRDWANKSLNRVNFEFIDYLAIPFVDELRTRNLKSNKTKSEIIENYLSSLKLLEEVAQVMFHLALEDTMPDMLSKVNSNSWLNAWAISLDISKWEADGLFTPKSEPRNLNLIKQQLWEAIGK